jgi:ketosteroid isomerase-like protein
MKLFVKDISLPFLLLCMACNSQPAKSEKEISKEILQSVQSINDLQSAKEYVLHVLETQVKAWNAGDIDGFMMGYWHSDSLRFITKNGIRYGYDSVSSNYKKHYDDKDKMGVLAFEDLSCSALGMGNDIMNVTGKWQIAQKDNKVISGFFSLIFKKFGNDWKIVIDHTW